MDTPQRENLIRILKFVLFSVSAGLIQVLVFTLLNELAVWPGTLGRAEYGPNYFIALVLSVLWNFTFNRKFTFQSAANVPVAMAKIFAYYCVFTPLSLWWGVALTAAGWNDYVVLIGTMACNLSTEFLVSRFWVYRGAMDTNDLARRQREKAAGGKEDRGP